MNVSQPPAKAKRAAKLHRMASVGEKAGTPLTDQDLDKVSGGPSGQPWMRIGT